MSAYDGVVVEARTAVGVHGAGEQRRTAYDVAAGVGAAQASATRPLPMTADGVPGRPAGSPSTVTGGEGTDTGEVPATPVAVTANEYAVPSARPGTSAVVEVPGRVTVLPPGVAVTVHDVGSAPPSSEGCQRTEAVRTPAPAWTATGAAGAVIGHGAASVPSAKAARPTASPAKSDMSTAPVMPGTDALAVYCHSDQAGQPPTGTGGVAR